MPVCKQYKSQKFKLAFLRKLIPAAIKPSNMVTSGSESNESDNEGAIGVPLNVMFHRFLSEVTLEEEDSVTIIRYCEP